MNKLLIFTLSLSIISLSTFSSASVDEESILLELGKYNLLCTSHKTDLDAQITYKKTSDRNELAQVQIVGYEIAIYEVSVEENNDELYYLHTEVMYNDLVCKKGSPIDKDSWLKKLRRFTKRIISQENYRFSQIKHLGYSYQR